MLFPFSERGPSTEETMRSISNNTNIGEEKKYKRIKVNISWKIKHMNALFKKGCNVVHAHHLTPCKY